MKKLLVALVATLVAVSMAGCVGIGKVLHVILLELSEDGMVRRMPDPLNYGSFREWCRHRLGLGADRGRCF
jgi:hypothetical protein